MPILLEPIDVNDLFLILYHALIVSLHMGLCSLFIDVMSDTSSTIAMKKRVFNHFNFSFSFYKYHLHCKLRTREEIQQPFVKHVPPSKFFVVYIKRALSRMGRLPVI